MNKKKKLSNRTETVHIFVTTLFAKTLYWVTILLLLAFSLNS